MVFIIGLLTAVLVLDCLLLILLVLMQLPKKEAGAGLAFGGAATDALFGAGSGNFLTKTTKYAAGFFFVVAIVLTVTHSHYVNRPGSTFRRDFEQAGQAPAPAAPAPAQTPTTAATVITSAPTAGGGLLPLGNVTADTNTAAQPGTGTNAPPQ
jgi:preprotein translocase subunit SecG